MVKQSWSPAHINGVSFMPTTAFRTLLRLTTRLSVHYAGLRWWTTLLTAGRPLPAMAMCGCNFCQWTTLRVCRSIPLKTCTMSASIAHYRNILQISSFFIIPHITHCCCSLQRVLQFSNNGTCQAAWRIYATEEILRANKIPELRRVNANGRSHRLRIFYCGPVLERHRRINQRRGDYE